MRVQSAFSGERTTARALTTSLPEKEEREQAEEDEECWGLGRETGEGEGESELSGDEESRWSSREASIRRARSFSQLSIPIEDMNTIVNGHCVCISI